MSNKKRHRTSVEEPSDYPAALLYVLMFDRYEWIEMKRQVDRERGALCKAVNRHYVEAFGR